MLKDAQQLPDLALRALLYEVSVTPKPGLVDPADPGPHPDMTVFTFIDSAVSLRSYFEACRVAGQTFSGTDLTQLFKAIRSLGMTAERTMFTATKGVNTHKGAIFSLGILVTASAVVMAQTQQPTTTRIFQTVKQMLVGLTEQDLGRVSAQQAHTAGERQYVKYGQGGIRAEAEAGYPTVTTIALPFLRQSTGTINQRLLDTLMMIAGHTADSNLIKRAQTPAVLEWMHTQMTRYFELGGCQTDAGAEFLNALNQTFLKRHLSLGGSADLLILTVFIGLMEETLN